MHLNSSGEFEEVCHGSKLSILKKYIFALFKAILNINFVRKYCPSGFPCHFT
jgi:hypothetical protein